MHGLTSRAIHVRQRLQSAPEWDSFRRKPREAAEAYGAGKTFDASGLQRGSRRRRFFMKKTVLISILLRSLTIQASFNFCTMQGPGFVFSLLPFIRRRGDGEKKTVESLRSHLQMFNTHPYLTAPVIGSVVRLEEEGDPQAACQLKKILMGPYAAIGDVFFWGALRSFSSACAVLLALKGVITAPLVLLLLYDPAHLWVRGMGFYAGYRQGKKGFDFIRRLELPAAAGRIRFASLLLIGLLAAVAADMVRHPWVSPPDLPGKTVCLALVLLFFLGIRRGVSQVKILYGMTALCLVIAI
jgi:PTS system mannose-specific IID component